MIKNRNEITKLQIDLSGPQGNAFALLGCARKLFRQGLASSERLWGDIELDMMSGDYEHLITVFDNEFGECVDLIR